MMLYCVLQLNTHVFPTPVRTEARVTKSRAGLSACVHQDGRAPLVQKVRKPSVHLPIYLFRAQSVLSGDLVTDLD